MINAMACCLIGSGSCCLIELVTKEEDGVRQSAMPTVESAGEATKVRKDRLSMERERDGRPHRPQGAPAGTSEIEEALLFQGS